MAFCLPYYLRRDFNPCNMKKLNIFYGLATLVLAIGLSADVNAQGRSRGNDRDRNNDNRDRDRNDNRDNDHDRNNNHDHDRGHSQWDNYTDRHDNRQTRTVYYYNDYHRKHPPVVIHHYQRPRYIYYRDYDVYYDCQKSVYITYSGRSWTLSTGVPYTMRHANLRNTSRYEVDYFNDDFPRYLERRRPNYVREYRDW